MQFDFGKNWKEFSEKKLTSERIAQAETHFHELLSGVNLKEKRFLDVGFGQGLSLLLAHKAGAVVSGIDVNPTCYDVVEKNKQEMGIDEPIDIRVGSILDDEIVKDLKKNMFDVVHSWGVLHHTGSMWVAIDNVCSLVRDGGFLIIAIYNKHWSSPLWKMIKLIYCKSPSFVQKALIWLFFPVIFFAKFLVTGKNPLKMKRGMDFFYNVVDWVGGYPYEYASPEEIISYVSSKGYRLVRISPSCVPTGCNEYIFCRLSNSSLGD
ncbi:MAG: class I SAM-dependent methyltransferase [Methanobacteriota archaeon]|nr:MAG: class I SAM-dependent methyltransferase [Euryarchaeota archaeon]